MVVWVEEFRTTPEQKYRETGWDAEISEYLSRFHTPSCEMARSKGDAKGKY